MCIYIWCIYIYGVYIYMNIYIWCIFVYKCMCCIHIWCYQHLIQLYDSYFTCLIIITILINSELSRRLSRVIILSYTINIVSNAIYIMIIVNNILIFYEEAGHHNIFHHPKTIANQHGYPIGNRVHKQINPGSLFQGGFFRRITHQK